MSLREHMNNFLKIFKDPLSVIELAKAECLPPVLHVSNIALLMHPDEKKLQENFTVILKGLINQKKLPAITVEEFIQFIADHESRRDTAECLTTKTEEKLPAITLEALAHADSDLLPDDVMVNSDEQLMYVVHRKDMKELLESGDDWPLPRDMLLSRWWPEVVLERNLLPLTPDALESSTVGKDAKKVTDTTFAEKVAAENIFRKEGQMWALCYDGVTKYFSHAKGLLYISYLLGGPFQEFHVAELVKAAETPEKEILSFSSGEVLTKETIENYRKKLSEIRAELSQADDTSDHLLKKELLEEKQALEKQLLQAVGMGGKLKKYSDETKRQANAVSMTSTLWHSMLLTIWKWIPSSRQ